MQGVPHVEIFPKHNKSEHHSILGERDRTNLMKLVKKYVKEDVPFEITINDKEDNAFVALQMLQMLFKVKNMPKNEQEQSLEMLKQMSQEIGLGNNNENNITSINETIENSTDSTQDIKQSIPDEGL